MRYQIQMRRPPDGDWNGYPTPYPKDLSLTDRLAGLVKDEQSLSGPVEVRVVVVDRHGRVKGLAW